MLYCDTLIVNAMIHLSVAISGEGRRGWWYHSSVIPDLSHLRLLFCRQAIKAVFIVNSVIYKSYCDTLIVNAMICCGFR